LKKFQKVCGHLVEGQCDEQYEAVQKTTNNAQSGRATKVENSNQHLPQRFPTSIDLTLRTSTVEKSYAKEEVSVLAVRGHSGDRYASINWKPIPEQYCHSNRVDHPTAAK